MSLKVIIVEVVSDVMCPWCWVGKRNLEAAIKQSAGKYEIQVKWHPFLLRDSIPNEGQLKSPDTPDNPRVGMHMKRLGLEAGIDFTGKTDRTPNTILSHNLLRYAFENEKGGWKVQNEVQEKLFQAYFTDGNFLDIDFLSQIGKEVGFDQEDVRNYIQSEAAISKTRKEANVNRRRGVSGVPSFFVNGKYMFSGGQPVENFIAAFDQAENAKKDAWVL